MFGSRIRPREGQVVLVGTSPEGVDGGMLHHHHAVGIVVIVIVIVATARRFRLLLRLLLLLLLFRPPRPQPAVQQDLLKGPRPRI